jgi:hypothetical protein
MHQCGLAKGQKFRLPVAVTTSERELVSIAQTFGVDVNSFGKNVDSAVSAGPLPGLV